MAKPSQGYWSVEGVDRNRVMLKCNKAGDRNAPALAVYCLFGEFVGPPDFEKQTQSVTTKISEEEALANAERIAELLNRENDPPDDFD